MAQQRTQSGNGEGESAQEFSAGAQRETRTAQGDGGRVGGIPLAVRGGSFMVVGIINLALSSVPLRSFHILMGIACCLSAGSFVIPVWKRSLTKAVDGIRGPVALVLSVWAIGLFGYVTGFAAGSVLDRFTAGFVGTAYVFFFAAEVLSEPRLLGIDCTRGGR